MQLGWERKLPRDAGVPTQWPVTTGCPPSASARHVPTQKPRCARTIPAGKQPGRRSSGVPASGGTREQGAEERAGQPSFHLGEQMFLHLGILMRTQHFVFILLII